MEEESQNFPLPPDWERRKAERVRKNEAAFRAHNERRKEFEQGLVASDERIPFACECGDANCYDPIELTIPKFDNAHAEERRYVVKPLHVMPDYERVVEQHDDHWVVEKYPPGEAPAEAAALAAEGSASP
jgi:hypothetical protein